MDLPKTMVHALHERAAQHEHRPALWTRRGRAYVPTSWLEYSQRVKHFALGLRSLGYAEGQPLGIISFNREEWHVAALASMAMGGVPVGLYTTSALEQLEYILRHCEASLLVVENEKHLRTGLLLRERLPKLRHLVVLDAPATPLPEGVLRYADVLARGAGADDKPYWDSVNALKPESLGTLIYTSGTTGHPKGVMLSHHNLTWTSRQLSQAVSFGKKPDNIILSYLPLSHIAEQVISLHCPLMLGIQVYFADSVEAMPANLKDVRPTFFFGVPRVWEKFKAKAEEGLRSQPPLKRRLVDWARGVASEMHSRAQRHERIPVTLSAQYSVARRLVFEPLKTRIGMERVDFFATAAAPIGRDVLEFFASIDMLIHEVWGMTEVSGPGTVNTEESTHLGTVGRPMLGVEVRIAEDGEILIRGGNVCTGYYKNPEATAELLQDGWLHSGDVGQLDGEGYLHITGRKKEIIVTSGGKKTAPGNIEELLKSLPGVGHAVVVGERRNYLVALLALDGEKVRALAREKGWPEEVGVLAGDARLHQVLQQALDRDVNAKLSRFENIKRFAVLPREFSVDEGDLTPTLKVRRKAVELKHAGLVESLYAENGAAHAG
ncbi:putative long-chain-fatty-acid--CoA ligase [Myxococcus stipitatus DSM 14675]|uniref:Putative long-chain-fatty-acid--CoA ligase n=1 Tax=Myxococcus stipitatus (strain DSM 14675 / JCM 12634 / Mx s8) TaxID=1278073 RepID=L7UCY6_MYXSD|nr:AMP-dependent synthetase/ligase [Myxococcus stipitatus]AGC45750.1 putative long-chain-fatty-acid--CoA ligase [Myxococcus stipitatus DSM 14675]